MPSSLLGYFMHSTFNWNCIKSTHTEEWSIATVAQKNEYLFENNVNGDTGNEPQTLLNPCNLVQLEE